MVVIPSLHNFEAVPVKLVGGKAASLICLANGGYRDMIPQGYVITTAFSWAAEEWVSILEAQDRLSWPVAVRSSATCEDGANASFAGQHDTILNVGTAPDLLAAINKVLLSFNNREAVEYREAMGVDGSMAVLVQEMVDADTAGVMFTTNPVTAANEFVIEAAQGLGDKVVGGEVTPTLYRTKLEGGTLIPLEVDGEDVLGLRELELLSRLGSVFGKGNDIEWAFDKSGKMWLLQCRPLTTL